MAIRMGRECRGLRRDLVLRLSVSRPVGAVIDQQMSAAELAEALGVSVELVVEAARVGRLALANATMIDNRRYILNVPRMLYAYLVGEARRLFKTSRASQAIRAILHAAMQTTYEPTPREHGDYAPALGASRRPPPQNVRRLFAKRNRVSIDARLSRGLIAVLDARSARYGVTRQRYIVLILLDHIDGLTKKVFDVEPVSAKDMFPQAENYVLPAPAHDAEGPEVLPSKTA